MCVRGRRCVCVWGASLQAKVRGSGARFFVICQNAAVISREEASASASRWRRRLSPPLSHAHKMKKKEGGGRVVEGGEVGISKIRLVLAVSFINH